MRWVYVEDPAAALDGDASGLAALPAFNEAQARMIESVVRVRPLLTVIGVVADVTGHATYTAVRFGASLVLNTLIRPSCYHVSLWGLARTHLRNHPLVPAPAFVDAGIAAMTEQAAPTGPDGAPPQVDSADAERRLLVRMLCSTLTNAEIASRMHCSERSMYRRLQRLYQDLGVSGRFELRRLVDRRHLVA